MNFWIYILCAHSINSSGVVTTFEMEILNSRLRKMLLGPTNDLLSPIWQTSDKMRYTISAKRQSGILKKYDNDNNEDRRRWQGRWKTKTASTNIKFGDWNETSDILSCPQTCFASSSIWMEKNVESVHRLAEQRQQYLSSYLTLTKLSRQIEMISQIYFSSNSKYTKRGDPDQVERKKAR